MRQMARPASMPFQVLFKVVVSYGTTCCVMQKRQIAHGWTSGSIQIRQFANYVCAQEPPGPRDKVIIAFRDPRNKRVFRTSFAGRRRSRPVRNVVS